MKSFNREETAQTIRDAIEAVGETEILVSTATYQQLLFLRLDEVIKTISMLTTAVEIINEFLKEEYHKCP